MTEAILFKLIKTKVTALTFRGSGLAFKDADTPSFKRSHARAFQNIRRWRNWIEASLFVNSGRRQFLRSELITTIVTALTFRRSGLAFKDADTPSFKGSFARSF